MDISEKKIYLVLSPHINYYHSYRGDSKGETGFGKDLSMMRGILDELDKIEDLDLANPRICWDWGDTFWSIQLQKEYQPDILDRVIERCKKGKDEVLIGQWGNVMQSTLDTEEFLQQHEWFLENSMGIGVNQLFPGRVAPYARTQESMFTQGMIELYNKVGVEGICNYYSVYGFDVTRPFLNPRLDWNQRYGVVKFNSTLSDASCLMIPTYGFGDILDYCSIKNWFKFIRNRQENGKIKGDALIFLNFDMDYENWLGLNLPKLLKWLPNSRGLMEFAEAVSQFEYAEFTNLLEIVPKSEIQGETTLREDVADGMWNGYYNWAQKYNNTKFWTIGQRARWLKCLSDTISSNNLAENINNKINNYLRNKDENSETYLKNKILLASTTNFGMAMPFLHSDRRKTAISYALKAFFSSEQAVKIAVKGLTKKLDSDLYILPISNRGISKRENIPLPDSILIRSVLPSNLRNSLTNNTTLEIIDTFLGKKLKSSVYTNNSDLWIEALIPKSSFKENVVSLNTIQISKQKSKTETSNQENISATERVLKNKFISIKFDGNGKICSFKFNDSEFACPKFLESSISFGNAKNRRNYNSDSDQIIVHRNGDDGFSASVSIVSEFYIEKEHSVRAEKNLKLYSTLPYLFVDVSMQIPDIKGDTINIGKSDGTSYFVEEEYHEKWQEIMPCEIRPNILGTEQHLIIWKRNFLGISDYFELDMKEVDSKNANIDCLVANISDGWMSLSNQEKGLLIGYNSLKAANFAFSPLRIRDKGFGDLKTKGQQVRVNPFGTYYGKLLHYWTAGNGHSQKIVTKLIGTNESTAPTFSGKTISFELIISPYLGDFPPQSVKNFADHFSFEPLVLFKQDDIVSSNYLQYIEKAEELKEEFDVEEVMNMSYIEWVRKVNQKHKPSLPTSSSGMPKISILNMLRMLIDGIRGR